jgi:hypothetical protein
MGLNKCEKIFLSYFSKNNLSVSAVGLNTGIKKEGFASFFFVRVRV